MADPLPVGAPLWWVERLEKKLKARRDEIQRYDDYYEGRHKLAFAGEKFLKSFGGLFQAFADNWCGLVVEAVTERLNVEGFRFGEEPDADSDAWRMWQANHLDAESEKGHNSALVKGDCAVTVWRGKDETTPSIKVDDARDVIVEYVPGEHRERAAALKMWRDDWTATDMATLYLPDAVYKYRARGPKEPVAPYARSTRWVERILPDEPWPLPNPLGVVPVVPLCNNPRLLVPSSSEIHGVIPVQDGINKLIADMLVASEFSAFRQRWVTGMDIPVDPETGQELEPFRAAVDRLFIASDQETKFGEFSETSLANFVAAVEMFVQHVASQTRTPPHYFYLMGQFPSGESIKSAETGLVAKARRKMRHFGEAWEEAICLGFAVIGDEARAQVVDAETIWADPESRTESEHVDAILKKKAINVPVEQLWEDLGYSPAQIERFHEMLRQQAIEQTALGLDIFGNPAPTPENAPPNGNTPAVLSAPR